jgi:hypothetical protein
MKYWLVFLLFLQFLSCGNSNKHLEKKDYNAEKTLHSDSCIYSFKNDTIYQTIRIVYSNNQIAYDYQVNNLKQNLNFSTKGNAIKKETENMELGEDEDGNSYPVDIYEFKDGNCWISISIDKDKKDKLTIIDTPECSTKNRQYTPVTSIGIMRKVK